MVGDTPAVDFYVYDRSNQDAFLGHVRLSPSVAVDNTKMEGWYKLEPRDAQEESVTGEVHLQLHFQKTDKKHYGPEDFQILKLIGKGLCLLSGFLTRDILIRAQGRLARSIKSERRTLNAYTP